MPDPTIDPPDEEPEAEPESPKTANRRFFTAILVYAGLAGLAAIRLDGRPRLVVWLFLGLFAIKTILAVLRQKSD